MATYPVTHIEGDIAGRQPRAQRFKLKSEADAFFEQEAEQGRFVIMYVEDYDRSGEVRRANDPNQNER